MRGHLIVSEAGWVQSVKHLPSTHYNARPKETDISLVVLHNITLPPGEMMTGCVEAFFLGSLDVKKDARLEELQGVNVSSHFFITRTGEIIQFVGCNERAWHAGVSSFLGRENCNDFSIGIELEGTDTTAFDDAQYVALNGLLRALALRYRIEAIVAHSDIAPGRKTDPGPYFDWCRLIEEKVDFGAPQFPGAAAKMAQSLRNAHAGVTL